MRSETEGYKIYWRENRVLHYSCYNSQSQGLIERKVGVLKDLLKKSGASLSQLQLDELIFEVNSREEPS